ncbi:MAG TPA: hypothetical protein PLI09_07540 [Candidatus Hydrogenedentes bacterium]|nr:hypothetical protein [Candidatus Hydrogenedentota bacterium]
MTCDNSKKERNNMLRGMKCLLVLLLAVMISAAASELGSDAECTAMINTPGVKISWGDNVQMTEVLFEGQTFNSLFAGDLLVSDAVTAWYDNLPKVPSGVSAGRIAAAGEALSALNSLFKANPDIKWTVKDLYLQAWDTLPPVNNEPLKKEILSQFKNLKNKAKVLSLTFVNRSANQAPSKEEIAAITKFAEHPTFGNMDMHALYHTAAAPLDADPKAYPDRFSDEDIDFLSDFMDGKKILRDTNPELLLQGADGRVLCWSKHSMCCSRTPGATYRKCVDSTVCCCTMCTIYCCTGSTWCP